MKKNPAAYADGVSVGIVRFVSATAKKCGPSVGGVPGAGGSGINTGDPPRMKNVSTKIFVHQDFLIDSIDLTKQLQTHTQQNGYQRRYQRFR